MRVAVVNHNSSKYTELALRSLLELNVGVDLDITIIDNSSDDDTAMLFEWATAQGAAIAQSGFSTAAPANTHGEVLRSFVLTSPPTDYFLFLDTDACFLRADTVAVMQQRLDSDSSLFAVQAEMRLYVTEAMGVEPRPRGYIEQTDGTTRRLFQRPHPFCLLVRDVPEFRSVVEHVGLSNASRSAAARELNGFYDTFGLAAAALRTHGYDWAIAGGPVLHYAQAAQRGDADDLLCAKDEDCDRRLKACRDRAALGR